MNSFHRKFIALVLLLCFLQPRVVSAHKHTRTIDNPRTKIQKFSLRGTSENIVLNDEHCGLLPVGCTVTFSGKAIVNDGQKANYTAQATIEWQNGYSNGRGGYCAPVHASGTLFIDQYMRSCNTDSVYFTVEATTCDETVTNELGIHLYNGTINITGGSGQYQNAKGTATLQAKDNIKERNGFFEANGSLSVFNTYQKHITEIKRKQFVRK